MMIALENQMLGFWQYSCASIYYTVRRLTTGSREISKPGDMGSKLPDRSEFDRRVDNSTAESPAQFQSGSEISNWRFKFKWII